MRFKVETNGKPMNCAVCDKEFLRRNSRSKYCSQACSNKDGQPQPNIRLITDIQPGVEIPELKIIIEKSLGIKKTGQIRKDWKNERKGSQSGERIMPMWQVKCTNCKDSFAIEQRNLLRLHRPCCRSCYPRPQLEPSDLHDIVKNHHWHGIQTNARRRGIPFHIQSKSLIEQKLRDQKFKCALTGLPIAANTKPVTASLDRIDSDPLVGYTLDNTQWVHVRINRMKSDLPEEKFIEYCTLVADKHRASS